MATDPRSTLSRPTSEIAPATSGGTLQRIPPQDIEAEMALLGAMMLDREAIGDVIPIIPRGKADQFYRSDHRKVYQVLLDLYERGEPVDLVSVKDDLRRVGLLDEIGGVDYIAQLAESVPNHLHAEYYAKLVRDKALLRDLISASARINDIAYAHSESAADILDLAEQYLFNVTDSRIGEQATTIRNQLEQILSQMADRQGEHITGVATGFLELDELLSGLQQGEMIVIAARPSMGKTAFALSMAEHIAMNDGVPTAFFSMEMSKQAIAQRLLCSRAGVDSQKVRRNMVSDAELDSLRQACGELAEMPLYVDDTPGMTALELRAKTRRLNMRHDVRAVFIDYLQLMHSTGRTENRQVEVAEISRALKSLARELNIPVVVMAQLNRNPEGRQDKKPILSDLRESGAIEQDADVVMLLHREEYYYKIKGEIPPDDVRGQAEVIVAKQRNGPTATVKVQFSEHLARFAPLSLSGEPAYVPGGGFAPGPEFDEATPF
ncbi:MAG TPA: replicative DNA helicase [Phycisphaerae bacterium]|nr:replicative DNA helicase [Phycisphaerae bacterium]